MQLQQTILINLSMANKKHWFIGMVLCLTLQTGLGQNATVQSDSTTKRSYLECMIFPTLLYNFASIGISKQYNARYEQALTFAGLFVYNGGYSIYSGLSLRYNSNFILHASKRVTGYVPLWLSPRYVYYSGNSEGDGTGGEALIGTLGTGYGLKCYFKNKHALRFEGGPGIAFLSFRDKRSTTLHSRKFEYAGVAPAFRFTVKYMIPL